MHGVPLGEPLLAALLLAALLLAALLLLEAPLLEEAGRQFPEPSQIPPVQTVPSGAGTNWHVPVTRLQFPSWQGLGGTQGPPQGTQSPIPSQLPPAQAAPFSLTL